MSELDHIIAKSRHAAAGGFGVLSTGEQLAAALVLNRPDWLARMNYTLAEAIERVGADWLALIPQAARQIADETEYAAQQAEIERADAILEQPTLTQAQGGSPDREPDFSASYVSCWQSPGYRNVAFVLDMTADGSSRTHRVRVRIRPEDAEPIIGDLTSAHRAAWRDPQSRPLDVEPGEERPDWIGA